MMLFISLVLTIFYMIWLANLINFGVKTATRIAVATEATALTIGALYQTLSPEAKERAEVALRQIRETETVLKAAKPTASGGLGVALAVAGAVALFAIFAVSLAHAGERSQSRSFYDRNGSFAGSSSTHGNSTSFTDRSGRFDGTAIRNSDGTTSFYDKSGHFTGSSTSTTQPK